MIKNKDLTFFNLTNARLLKRMSESREIYEDVLIVNACLRVSNRQDV